MTDVDKGLAEILADYAATMKDLERHKDAQSAGARSRRVLLPADQQRGCATPRCDDFGRRRWLR